MDAEGGDVKSNAKSLATVLRHPLTWATAFTFTASEASSLFALGVGGENVFPAVTPDALAAVAYAAVFLWGRSLEGVLRRPAACLVLGLLGIGALCLGYRGEGALGTVGWLAMAAFQCSSVGLMLTVLLCLAGCPQIQVRSIVVASAILNAALLPVAEAWPLGTTAVCVAAGACALALACRRPEEAHVLAATRPRRALRAPWGLMAGFLVVAVSFGFLQTLLYQQSQEVVLCVVVATKLGATALFALVLLWQNDTSYSTLAKLVVTLATGSFLVFLAQGSYSPLASVFMATGYSLMEMTTLLLLADLASYARWSPLRLFSAFYLIEIVGYVAGCLLSDGALLFDVALLRLVAVGLAMLLLVCAVWVFNETRVNAFTWGSRGDEGYRVGEERAAEGRASISRGRKEAVGLEEAGALAGQGGSARVLEVPPPPSTHDSEIDEGSLCASGSLTGQGQHGTTSGDSLSFAERIGLTVERYRLTEREAEVLALFATGRSAAFIAELKFVTVNTIRSHIKHIYAKCGVHSRQELISLIEATGKDSSAE